MYVTVVSLAFAAFASGAEPEKPVRAVECAGPRGRVGRILFSPDDRWLAATADDDQITKSGGKTSRVSKGHDLFVWDALTGKIVVNLQHGPKSSGHAPIAFLPDGKTLLASKFEQPTRKLIGVAIPGGTLTDKNEYPTGPANYWFSTDRTVVVTRSNVANAMSVWKVPVGEKPLLMAEYDDRAAGGAGLSADGKVAMAVFHPPRESDVAGKEWEVTIWDVPTAKTQVVFRPKIRAYHSEPILSPNGKLIAGYEWERMQKDGRLTVWETANGRATTLAADPMRSLQFTADSRTLVGILKGNQVGFVDVATGKLKRAISCPFPSVNRLVVSTDGKRVAIVGGELNDTREVRILEVE